MPGLIPAHPSAWMEDRQKDVLEVPRESRKQTEQINLEEAFLRRVPMLKSVPLLHAGTVSPQFDSHTAGAVPREVGWRQGWRRASFESVGPRTCNVVAQTQ